MEGSGLRKQGSLKGEGILWGNLFVTNFRENLP